MAHPPLLTRAFLLLVLGHFLQALGFSSMLLLPLYLDHLGASRAEIGAIMAASNVGGLLSRPLVGWALDAWGRKPTLLCGTAFLVLGMLGLVGVDAVGPYVYADRVLMGVGTGTLFAGYFTWATDLIPEHRRTEGVALFGVSGLAPLALNAFVDDLGVAAPDLRLFFPALGGVIALSALALLALPEPPKHADPDGGATPRYGVRAVVRALAVRSLWPVWVATGVFAALVGVFMAFATVTGHARGVPDPAKVWLTYSLGAVFVRLLGARIPDRVGPANMVAPALALYLGALVWMALFTTQRELLALGVLAGLGHGYCFPVLMSQVVTRSPARYRGSAISAWTAVWGACELALPPLFGWIADMESDSVMYMAATGLALALLTVWCPLEHRFGQAPSPVAQPAT